MAPFLLSLSIVILFIELSSGQSYTEIITGSGPQWVDMNFSADCNDQSNYPIGHWCTITGTVDLGETTTPSPVASLGTFFGWYDGSSSQVNIMGREFRCSSFANIIFEFDVFFDCCSSGGNDETVYYDSNNPSTLPYTAAILPFSTRASWGDYVSELHNSSEHCTGDSWLVHYTDTSLEGIPARQSFWVSVSVGTSLGLLYSIEHCN